MAKRTRRSSSSEPEPPKGTPIGDTTTDQLRSAVALAMATMSSQGSVPAATALLKLLDSAEEADASRAHQARLEALDGDRVGLADYLGELGVELTELQLRLGGEVSPEERLAWERGHQDRALEVRALELHQLRTSGGKPPDWTRRKP